MQLKQMAIKVRHDKIVDFLAEPHSLKHVAALTGTSYYTARNDVYALMKEEKVRLSGTHGPNGDALFISGGKRPMPIFTIGTGQRSMQNIAYTYGLRGANNATESIEVIYKVALELMQLATNPDSPPSKKTLLGLRKTLSDAKIRVDSALSIAQQMLDRDELWEPNDLIMVSTDEEFNKDEVLDAYSKYLDRIPETPIPT